MEVLAITIGFSLWAEQTLVHAAPEASPTVRTVSGIVRGVTQGAISSFKGIPYAAAPVGENRWRPPQPVPAWEGVRDASEFGADCAQAGWPRGSGSIAEGSSEDCLYLNLWCPARTKPGAKLPVMVWIHGGAFVAIMMNTYWANFARTGNPNGEGLPEWPVYDTRNEEILDIQPDGKLVGKPDPRKARLDVIEKAGTLRTHIQSRGGI